MGPNEKKLAALEQKLADLGIRKRIWQKNSSNHLAGGGQKVNTSSSAVFIRHKTTGLTVKMGRHRSLHLNRFLALRALAEKLEALQSGTDTVRQEQIKKIRRQKLRRRQKTRKKLASAGNATDE